MLLSVSLRLPPPFITRAIRSSMELPVLEAIVGHVDRETTKIYTHLHADDLVNAVSP